LPILFAFDSRGHERPDAENVLDVHNFFQPRKTPAIKGVNPNAPTGDPFVDLMLGKGAKEPDPVKWRIPIQKRSKTER
jgi:hypothetical protein